MAELTIWHNPKCSKSRNALTLIEEKELKVNINKYLETKPSFAEIKEVLSLLNIPAFSLLRKNEEEYKDLNLKDETNEDKLIEAMVTYPKLIERPIIIKNNKAVIARPIENLEELLKDA